MGDNLRNDLRRAIADNLEASDAALRPISERLTQDTGDKLLSVLEYLRAQIVTTQNIVKALSNYFDNQEAG